MLSAFQIPWPGMATGELIIFLEVPMHAAICGVVLPSFHPGSRLEKEDERLRRHDFRFLPVRDPLLGEGQRAQRRP